MTVITTLEEFENKPKLQHIDQTIENYILGHPHQTKLMMNSG